MSLEDVVNAAPSPGADNEAVAPETEAAVTDANAIQPGAEQSSTAPDQDANTADTSSTADGAEDGKSDAEDKPKVSLADVVQDALKPEKPEESKDDANKDGKPADSEEGVKAESSEDAENADSEEVPKEFHNHPAWKRIIGERDEVRSELETLKPAAEQFGKITSFMETHSIPPQEIADAMTIVAMMKTPDSIPAAVEKLQALVDQGRAMMGTGIASDLVQKVDEGEISEAYAKELTQARTQAEMTRKAAERSQETAETATQEVQQRDVQAAAQRVKDQASAYLSDRQKADPDYAVKAPFLKNAVAALRTSHQGEMTPEAGLQIVKTAYEQVTENLRAALPQRKATAQTPSSTAAAPAASQQKPKTLQDAIAIGLNGAAAA